MITGIGEYFLVIVIFLLHDGEPPQALIPSFFDMAYYFCMCPRTSPLHNLLQPQCSYPCMRNARLPSDYISAACFGSSSLPLHNLPSKDFELPYVCFLISSTRGVNRCNERAADMFCSLLDFSV